MNVARYARSTQRRRYTQESASSVNATRKHRPDYVIVLCMILLLAIGAVTVYAISPGISQAKNLSESYYSTKQLIAIALGIVAFIVASLIPIRFWRQLQIPLAVAALGIAIAVRIVGEEVNGAYRWLQIGGFSFQAAELIKLALVIGLAGYLVQKRIDKTLDHPDTFKRIGVLVLTISVIVAGIQSDLGSTAVMLAIIGAMAFIAGLPLRNLALFGAAVILLVSVAIMISPYRRDRVSTFLNPTADCQNEGYQVCQALITVGSGGMFGKGLGRSVQAYGYLPEAANDSIFAIVAEKFGFLGSTFVIGIFFVLFKRIHDIAQSAANDYARLLVSGILVWLSTQMIINVGAMLGVLPLKGITLPFVSYGGTSIIFVMAAIGIVFQISRFTDLSMRSSHRQAQGSYTPLASRVVRRGVLS